MLGEIILLIIFSTLEMLRSNVLSQKMLMLQKYNTDMHIRLPTDRLKQSNVNAAKEQLGIN